MYNAMSPASMTWYASERSAALIEIPVRQQRDQVVVEPHEHRI
jgi:hypothetical protein